MKTDSNAGIARNAPADLATEDPESIAAALQFLWDAKHTTISRRKFCNGLLLTSGGVMLAASTVKAKATYQYDSMMAYPPLRIEGAEKMTPGSAIYFSYPMRYDSAILLRDACGEYRAFSRKCSHVGCSVEFDPSRSCLECPCHKGTYDMQTGLVLYGPPPRPLDQIILQIRAGGQVWAVGKSVGRSNEVLAHLRPR